MNFSHDKKKFIKHIKSKNNFIFYKKINKLKSSPISQFIHIVEKNNYSFLYESVEKGKEKGRYSICGYKSIKTIEISDKSQNKKIIKKKFNNVLNIPFSNINKTINKYKFKKEKNLPPMSGAFFGYIAYENIYNVEKISERKKKNVIKTPGVILFIPEILVIYDNVKKSLYILKHFINENKNQIKYDENVKELNALEKSLKSKSKKELFDLNKIKKLKIKSNVTKKKFINNINIAKKYIKNGDIFQVVPSQRFEIDFKSKPSHLYRVLRKTNPSPFMYYFNLPKFNIVGSSPEILIRIRSNIITLRPIAGTRPRGKNRLQDKKNELDLLSDKKEVSEHLMLLDLGRNDVGRVAKKSTVNVTAKFIIEKYSHVMHIVSNVIGKLKEGVSPIEALMSGFPAGTVSGAPKIRAMQIIDELENDMRGIYSGGIGYITPGGDMDTCIVLRTGIITKNKLYVQAGAGIVYDSNPELEYMETVNKAKAVLNAAAIVLGNNK